MIENLERVNLTQLRYEFRLDGEAYTKKDFEGYITANNYIITELVKVNRVKRRVSKAYLQGYWPSMYGGSDLVGIEIWCFTNKLEEALEFCRIESKRIINERYQTAKALYEKLNLNGNTTKNLENSSNHL